MHNRVRIVENVGSGRKQILSSIVIEVEGAGSPSGETAGQSGQPGPAGSILELAATKIAIEGKGIAEHSGMKDFRFSVVVQVAKIRSHSGHSLAVSGKCNSGLQSHVREGSVAVVVKEKVLEGVIRDEDIGEAVVVVVGKGYAHSLADVLRDMRLRGDVGKRSVAIVAVKDVVRTLKSVRGAVGRYSILIAKSCGMYIVVEIVDDKKIKKSIVVVIEPPCSY